MDLSVCVALSASWRAASTRDGHRQAPSAELARFGLNPTCRHGKLVRVEFPTAPRSCAWQAPRARRRGKLSHRSSSLIRPGFLSNQTGPALMPLQQAFPGSDYKNSDGVPCNQLNLFAF